MESKAPHKVWSGTLAFGLITMPVQLFTAARTDRLSFNMLHDCGEGRRARLKQQPMICSDCVDVTTLRPLEVDKASALKGYEYAKGQFVTFTPDEIRQTEPDTARTLELMEFVPLADVDPIYLEDSFFLAPGDGANKVFTLVRQAMLDKEVVAVSRFYYSGSEHVALIRPYSGGMMLHLLFWAHEVRNMVFPSLTQVNPAELQIAGQLVDALVTIWEPNKYTDDNRTRLLGMIEDKKQGKPIEAPKQPSKPVAPVIDIAAALAASVAKAKQKGRAA